MEGANKPVGWIERLKELRELQQKSHTIVGSVIGSDPMPDPDEKIKAAEHFAGSLTDLLSSAIGSAKSLNLRLHNIQERF